MQNYEKFFIKNPNGVLGTVENGEARTRTFQILWIKDGNIYFCTGAQKQVYQQIIENDKVAFTSLNIGTFESVSITGSVVFIDDYEEKVRALEENPGIKSIYGSADNQDFKLFYVKVENVSSFIFDDKK